MTDLIKSPDERLLELGIELPDAQAPAANYVPFTRAGNLMFVSGQGPIVNGEVLVRGTVGMEISEQTGYEAARLAAVNALAVLKHGLGNFNEVKRVVKLLAWVRSAPGFQSQHLVVNGASDLLVNVFGERGLHARSAVSATELPFGITVEIELVVETYSSV